MISSAKPFLAALQGQKADRPPFWLMRQAGRYLPEYRAVRQKAGSFLDLCYNPDLAVEVTLQPLRRYGMDAAILFSDILVIPHALGLRLEFLEGEGPRLETIATADDLRRLEGHDIHTPLAPVYETVNRLRAALAGTETALIGFAGAPWTLACYMVQGSGSKDWEKARRLAFGDPALFASLLNLLADVTGDYLAAQVDAGAEALQIFDSWAGAVPAAWLDRLIIAPTQRLVARVKARHPNVPIIGFPRGCGLGVLPYTERAGVDAVALDAQVPPDWAAANLQPLRPVQGNLDPVLLMTGGTAMQEGVDGILRALTGGPFIFNLGHGVLPATAPERVAELAAQIRVWPERRG